MAVRRRAEQHGRARGRAEQSGIALGCALALPAPAAPGGEGGPFHELSLLAAIALAFLALVFWRRQRRLRKAMEARASELALSEARLELALEASGVGLWEWDLRTNRVFYSRSWKRQIGYEDHEISDSFDEWRTRVHPDDLDRMLRTVQAFVQEPWPNYEVEFRFRHKDGDYRWILTRAELKRDAQGRAERMLGCHIDITDLKRIEEELKLGEARYRELFESNPNPMWVYDLETLRFLDVNHAAIRKYGYSRDEFLRMKITEIRPAEEIPRLLENIARVQEGFDDAGIWTHRKKDGTLLKAEVTSHTMDWNGRRAEIVQAQDVTERLRAEAEREKLEADLRQAQKMEAVGRLAGGVAHDFNNNLTIILGYCELILNRLKKDDPLYKQLSEIRRAGESSARLTKQLLAFSRKQTIALGALDLNQSILEFEQMIRRVIGENIQLELHLAEGLSPVMGDAGQIQQILMNLAVNARDAMPGGGVIMIATSQEGRGQAVEGGEKGTANGGVLLLFSDTGTGMDEGVREHIFEPFFTTKGGGVGTGLGLSTVYGIVQQMGGTISVDTEPGSGTTFKIRFPACPAGETPARERSPGQQWGQGRETILVAEDQDDIRGLAASILDEQGYRVIASASGAEAIRCGEQEGNRIDLLLTDVVMPGMTGKELAERLSARHAELKVLYMSGYTADVIGRQGVLEPGTDFLAKPFTPAELTRKVREVLDRGRRAGSRA